MTRNASHLFWIALVVFLFCQVSLSGPSACGQDSNVAPKLRVGVKRAEPFVIVGEQSSDLSGFSIDLIKAIAAEMDPPRKVEFTLHDDISQHLEAVERGEVDVGISATSFTSERESRVDFSIPFYQGGLGIATRASGKGVKIWDLLTSADLRRVMFWTILFLVICANIIWFTEKGQADTFDDRWIIGVGEALWWTVVTMTTVGYGDFVPRKPLSRVIGVVIIVVGIVLFGVAVGSFSSAMTIQQLTTDIRVPDDLRHKPVAVVSNSISEMALRQRGVAVVPKADLPEALKAVTDHEVVAAVHDIALLRHHIPRNAPDLALVGPTFAEHGYGMTFPGGSKLRKRVNFALLQLMEGETPRYRELLNRWFETP